MFHIIRHIWERNNRWRSINCCSTLASNLYNKVDKIHNQDSEVKMIASKFFALIVSVVVTVLGGAAAVVVVVVVVISGAISSPTLTPTPTPFLTVTPPPSATALLTPSPTPTIDSTVTPPITMTPIPTLPGATDTVQTITVIVTVELQPALFSDLPSGDDDHHDLSDRGHDNGPNSPHHDNDDDDD